MMHRSTRHGAASVLALLLGANASSAAVVPFPGIPEGAMTNIPLRAPSRIAAGERVSGLFVAEAPPSPGAPKYRRFEILDSLKDATSFAQKGYVPAPSADPLGTKHCVYTTDDSSVAGDPWPVLARGEISTYPGSNQKPVFGVHVESLAESASAKTASLEIVDAWLDTRTRGLKLVEKAVVPLEAVAEGPFGIRVFAAKRDGRVSFVVLPPPAGKDGSTLGGQFDRGIVESGGEVGVSQCRHSRLTLEALPGSGEHAVVTFQHVEQAPHEAADGTPVAPDAARSDVFATSRTRVVQVHLSASRNRTASEPIVSVSFRVDKPKPLG